MATRDSDGRFSAETTAGQDPLVDLDFGGGDAAGDDAAGAASVDTSELPNGNNRQQQATQAKDGDGGEAPDEGEASGDDSLDGVNRSEPQFKVAGEDPLDEDGTEGDGAEGNASDGDEAVEGEGAEDGDGAEATDPLEIDAEARIEAEVQRRLREHQGSTQRQQRVTQANRQFNEFAGEFREYVGKVAKKTADTYDPIEDRLDPTVIAKGIDALVQRINVLQDEVAETRQGSEEDRGWQQWHRQHPQVDLGRARESFNRLIDSVSAQYPHLQPEAIQAIAERDFNARIKQHEGHLKAKAAGKGKYGKAQGTQQGRQAPSQPRTAPKTAQAAPKAPQAGKAPQTARKPVPRVPVTPGGGRVLPKNLTGSSARGRPLRTSEDKLNAGKYGDLSTIIP
jgi:hypothetical protein